MEYISIIKDDVDLSKSHRYLRIPHPRTGQAQLYLPYESATGDESILEVSKISGSQRRTWFIGDNGIDAGNILMHYPIDPLFLVIPLILAVSTKSFQFQPLSDILTDLPTHPKFCLSQPFTASSLSSSLTGQAKGKGAENGTSGGGAGYNADLAELLNLKIVRRVFRACCEVKDLPSTDHEVPGGQRSGSDARSRVQRYYKPSPELVVKHLKRKIEHFAQVSEFEKFDHLVRSLGRDGLLGDGADIDELRRLARIRAACDHMQQWLDPEIAKLLAKTYDFSPLTKHLSDMTAAAIAASQMPSNTKSDKDAAAAAAGKGVKRKGSAASRGVEALKKVNTNNMAKLTSFFKPKEGDEKAKPTTKKKK
ncbi:hypothetical protein IAT40_007929 [Kwoniella sp. CBS 6097]